ncbi:MAG: hypothetical protein RSE23_12135 [Clostridia bacterium]
MKKKWKAGFVLAMSLILLASVALAWGLSYSQEVSDILKARSLVMEKYGLSREAMDMFGGQMEQEERGAAVRFTETSENEGVREKMGIYTVLFAKDGSTAVQWTHDDVDPASWADGSLEALVWGEKQIVAYRAMREQEQREQQAEWEKKYGGGQVAETPMPTAVPQGKLTHEQALEIAAKAMKEAYHFTEKDFLLFRVSTSLTAGEKGTWTVAYQPANVAMELGGTASGLPLGDYTVSISDENGEVQKAEWSLEGVEHGVYTQQTWGQAKAYCAEMLPWVAQLVSQCEVYLQKAEAIPGASSVEEHAAYDQLFRDAGFDAKHYNHVVPQAGDITYDQAVEMVAKLLYEEYGVSRAVFDASVFAYADLTQKQDQREWYFWVQNAQEQNSWTVVLNAENGMVLYLGIDPSACGNG